MPRQRYKGIFNYHGQIIEVYTTATSINRAFRNMCQCIADQSEVGAQAVRSYFYDTTKYEINVIDGTV